MSNTLFSQNDVIDAINVYPILTIREKKTLQTLIEMSINYKVVFSVADLSERLKTTKTTVYAHLKILSDHKILIKSMPSKKGRNSYFINLDILNQIVEYYKKNYRNLENL